MWSRLRSFVRAFVGRDRFERTMSAEIEFHLDARAEDLIRSGASREDALRQARLEFGGVESTKDTCRDAKGLRLLDALGQNVRYAGRSMVKAPLLSAAAVASLALGIGANTALFGFVDAVFLRTLPLRNPQGLYYLGHHAGPRTSANYPLFERYRDSGVFDGVTAYVIGTFSVTTAESVEPVTGQFVSGNYHGLLGVPIALGRGFTAEADRDASAPPIAVISDGYWRRRFGRDPAAIGRTQAVNGRTVEIVGVTEPGFHGLDSASRVDITVPFSVMARDAPDFFDDHDGWGPLRIVARAAGETSEAQTLAAADVVFQTFMGEPEQQWVFGTPVGDSFQRVALLPAGRGSDELREQTAVPLRLLAAMAGILLAVACANVANLLLARATSRGREVAVRVSLGASRPRLIGQFLTEGLLLALCGGVAGLLVALWTSAGVLSLLEAGPGPFQVEASLNVRILSFALAISALTGIGFALVPAIRAARVDAAPALKTADVVPRGPRRLFGRLLVSSQTALCVLLLVSAGLLGKSLRNLETVDTGFDRERVALADVSTAGRDFTPDSRMAFYAAAAERLRRLPGVLSVSLASRTPIDASSRRNRIYLPEGDPGGVEGISPNVVTPEYFRTFGIGLVRGRSLTDDDRAETPLVAVVSERMARDYFGASDPIGRRFVFGGSRATVTVVGIVEDVRHERLREPAPPPMVYTALAQAPAFASADADGDVPTRVTVAVRTAGDARAASAAIPGELRRLERGAMVTYPRTMERQLDAALVRERLVAVVSAAFGGLALLLACVGLYGTLSFQVVRRSREIGIRMALGAARATVLWRILRESLTITTLGAAVGGIAALGATRWLSSMLFELSPRDPAILLTAIGTLLVTALVAGYLPARRAASVDPVVVLKAD